MRDFKDLCKELDELLERSEPVPCNHSYDDLGHIFETKQYKNDFIRKTNRLVRDLKKTPKLSDKVDILGDLVTMVLQFQLYGVK